MSQLEQQIKDYIFEQRHYFERGFTQSIAFRKEMLMTLKEVIQEHEHEIVDALQQDLGKHAFESYVTEIGFVLSSITNTIQQLEDWIEKRECKTPLYLQPAKSYTVRDAYGVVLIIGPFNYPFQLVMEPLIGSIAGGNCTIVKPSEHTPATAAVVEKILERAFPLQYVRVVQGAIKETQALLANSFDKIFFTGSQKVGKIVMKAAAEHLTPVTLELGGKSPAIVDPTAKIKTAAERIAWGKFVNNGQTCVAPDYVLVHHSKKGQLIKELIAAIERFYGKNAYESEDYGRIAQHSHWNRLVGLLDAMKEEIVYGGYANYDEKFIAPTLLDRVTLDSKIMEEEIFGPILPIVTFETLEEAIHIVSQFDKPLAAYFFSESEEAIDYFTTYLQFGGGCINDTLAHVGNVHLPFGGVGPSGIGNYHGKASIEAFTHEKAMMRKSTTLSPTIAYPPYKGKLSLVKKVMK